MKFFSKNFGLQVALIYILTFCSFSYIWVALSQPDNENRHETLSLSSADLTGYYHNLLRNRQNQPPGLIDEHVLNQIHLELDLSINEAYWKNRRSDAYKLLIKANAHLQCIITFPATKSMFGEESITGIASFKKVAEQQYYLVPFETHLKSGRYDRTKLTNFSEPFKYKPAHKDFSASGNCHEPHNKSINYDLIVSDFSARIYQPTKYHA